MCVKERPLQINRRVWDLFCCCCKIKSGRSNFSYSFGNLFLFSFIGLGRLPAIVLIFGFGMDARNGALK